MLFHFCFGVKKTVHIFNYVSLIVYRFIAQDKNPGVQSIGCLNYTGIYIAHYHCHTIVIQATSSDYFQIIYIYPDESAMLNACILGKNIINNKVYVDINAAYNIMNICVQH